MKHKAMREGAVLATATLLSFGLLTTPAAAKEHHRPAEYRVLSQESLSSSMTTDLFLRKDAKNHQYLYVASADNTLSVFDVTDPKELRKVQSLALSGASSMLRIRPVSNYMAIATDAPDTGSNLTVLNFSNLPSTEIASQLKNVDAYAIDGDMNTLYVAQQGKLVVMRFGHPITREAEIWEESYNSR